MDEEERSPRVRDRCGSDRGSAGPDGDDPHGDHARRVLLADWPPRGVFLPIDPRDIARRLLLATGATWNVLLPFAAAALMRVRGTRVAAALAAPIALSTAQILIASDTSRPVAAAYPFVMAAAAMELDRLPPKCRTIVSILVVLAQIPWLLTYAWVARLPLRGMEIALALATMAAAIVVWWQPRAAGGAISA